MKNVCIYGAGAIGGWLGVKLARAGCEVSVVARAATLETVKQHGLRLKEGEETLAAPVRASASPAELGPQDLVVIAVKSQAMPDVAMSIDPLLRPDTVVLTAMNGVPWWFFEGFGGEYAGTRLKAVDPEGAIARAIPAKHIVGCVVHASCSVEAPGLVKHHFGNGLIVGEPAGGESARMRDLAALLAKAGFDAKVSPQIQKDVWYKLWGNMSTNPVSAITGATTDKILADELVREFTSRVMLEAKEIGARIGVKIDQMPEDRHQITRKLGAFRTSMLQDVEAGKSVELDAIVTVVKELGGLTGVATPFTDALLGLARLHARVHGLY
jgi:2-dehydropantoate 2-reductase